MVAADIQALLATPIIRADKSRFHKDKAICRMHTVSILSDLWPVFWAPFIVILDKVSYAAVPIHWITGLAVTSEDKTPVIPAQRATLHLVIRYAIH
jgi:hypothetical protein